MFPARCPSWRVHWHGREAKYRISRLLCRGGGTPLRRAGKVRKRPFDKHNLAPYLSLKAQVAELVDALVSGTSAARRGGSSPLLGTTTILRHRSLPSASLHKLGLGGALWPSLSFVVPCWYSP